MSKAERSSNILSFVILSSDFDKTHMPRLSHFNSKIVDSKVSTVRNALIPGLISLNSKFFT